MIHRLTIYNTYDPVNIPYDPLFDLLGNFSALVSTIGKSLVLYFINKMDYLVTLSDNCRTFDWYNQAATRLRQLLK